MIEFKVGNTYLDIQGALVVEFLSETKVHILFPGGQTTHTGTEDEIAAIREFCDQMTALRPTIARQFALRMENDLHSAEDGLEYYRERQERKKKGE